MGHKLKAYWVSLDNGERFRTTNRDPKKLLRTSDADTCVIYDLREELVVKAHKDREKHQIIIDFDRDSRNQELRESK